jgi:hypothetical protein
MNRVLASSIERQCSTGSVLKHDNSGATERLRLRRKVGHFRKSHLTGFMMARFLAVPLTGYTETEIFAPPTGNFAVPGPSPRCDGPLETLGSGLFPF